MDIKELYKLYQQHPCITTDSRNCPEGSIFLALRGESFDGNKYALQALEKGCSYAIVDEDIDEPSSRLLKVDDCLQTFKDLAREHRRQFNIPVVGITGTNGKTTTKELIRAVLSECYNVMATEGNFNNDVGVPKTLFRLTDEHDIAVVEMGASHPGDIKTLVETAEPNCGLITNVGRAHLQGFGSFEGVCKTKGELYDFLVSHDCPIFINRDNEHLMQMIQERGQQPDLYFYGQSDNQDILIRGEVVSCAPFLKFRWREQDAEAGFVSEWMEVQTHLIGAYNLDNMLAAITVGYVNNIPFEQINHALENYVPTNNRSQLTETEKNHLIVDAYNANPTSMKAALDNFRLMEVSPKMAILGKMGELGDVSDEEHQKIIKLLEEARFDEVWLVGEEFQKVNSSFRTFANVDEVKAAIAQEQPQGRYILIKGSNSTHLYELPALL
ncbi:UDP-N-acetylmuramoyl-tripeptide--D-alanyl-D-alanine ligase [Prevotella sp. tc2-28]|uniref:UDP-N-acetylmuramoyl-tripeptide--D-alanyl-D- alanine ligase n=1 Tax=Prevotella sp. tc2-28 TaxID=1761888 RepID=UPI00089991CE|nr:UDP-N-acetylmuramoyl-tripeptide--D-alanyl-D-alanine ligase [Prevotella sp. tc2-28]SEA44119.1 UDP-N-acetylmuramoyl-tripeptide--D-alanyl-D-alanine ligase [Prevotella sp. tc2-28]